MARRRSQNRRVSRRTMNITELDQDSDLINTHDAMWWRNIEGDLTVNPLRRSIFEDTTEPILDGNSFVDSSELRKEWWKTLDQTNVNLPRRSSSRKSARRIETPHESSDSDDTQKITPHTRSERSAAAANSTVARNKSNNREDPFETSVNTSFDIDTTVKSRLRPFKKRFAKAPDSDFQDTLKNASPTETNNTNKSSRQERTPMKARQTDEFVGPPKPASSRKKSSSISRKLNLTEDESEGEAVAKKPKLGSAKKIRKIVSMNPLDELIENSSEPENSSFEHRRSNSMERSSALNYSLSTISDTRGHRKSGAKHRSLSTMKGKSENRLEASENRKNVPRESLIGENSQSQRIEEPSDHEHEKIHEKSSSSSLISKTLEVSLTRISPRRKTLSRRVDESDETPAKKTKKVGRTLRSSKRIIIDSPYELPDQERSGASQITDSDNEKEKTLHRNSKSRGTLRVSLRSIRSKKKHDSIDSMVNNVPGASTSRRRTRGDDSRTRIFSDEDISIEDLGYMAERGGILARPEEENIRVTRKSSASNRSSRNIPSEESTSEQQAAKTTKSISKSLHSKENILRSPRSQTPSSEKSLSANKSQRRNESDVSFSDEEPEVDEETRAPNLSSNKISRRSRKSIADENYRDENEEIVDEEEIEDEIPQESAKNLTANESRVSVQFSEAGKNTIDSRYIDRDDNRSKLANETARESRKIVAQTHSLGEKSRRTELFIDSEDEPEMVGEPNSPIMSSRSNRNSRKSRVAEEVFSQSGESAGENESNDRNELRTKSGRSDLREKSAAGRKSATINKSRGFVENDENNSEDEREETEKSYTKAINSRIEKSHASEKNRTANKSQRRILSDDDKSESEPENAQETEESQPREKSRPTTRSLRSDESEKIIETDESFSEDEAENLEKTSSVSANLRKSQRSFDNLSSQENSAGIEADALDRTSRQKNVVRSVSTAQESKLDDIIDEDEVENERHSSIARKTASNARASKNTSIKSSFVAEQNSTIPPNNSLLAPRQSAKQRKITDFVPGRFLQSIDDTSRREITKPLDPEKLKRAMQSAEEMKKRMLKSMALENDANKKAKSTKRPIETTKKKQVAAKETIAKKVTKVVDKAYIVNGVVYKRPRLPRPCSWATDRLYRHLWKLMEPKFGIATRVKSEKFVLLLSKVVKLTVRRKKYENYKLEVDDLMMKMARLGIIKTRNDFYDFCYDFLPYDFRVKTTPILLPGNINSIPYDPTTLHTPLLEET